MFCPRCHRSFDPSHAFCPSDGSRLLTSADVATFQAKPTRETGVVLGGRYEVRGFIGKGAMARVYLAEDHETHGPVAVKILEPAHGEGGVDARDRFLRETQAVEAHRSPEHREARRPRRARRPPYIVMEFLFGESLGDQPRRGESSSRAWRRRRRATASCARHPGRPGASVTRTS